MAAASLIIQLRHGLCRVHACSHAMGIKDVAVRRWSAAKQAIKRHSVRAITQPFKDASHMCDPRFLEF